MSQLRTSPEPPRAAKLLLAILLCSASAPGQTALPAAAEDAAAAHVGTVAGLPPPPATERGGEGADSTLSGDENQGGFEIARHFSLILIPKIFADAWLLRDYVRSDEFARLRREQGDLAAADAMFARARKLSWHNNAEALMISLAASIDHRRVGIRIPPFGITLWLPLTSEFPGEFDRRIAALPGRLYPDTPPGPAGDRDKLQHFFGSALLAFLFESPAPAGNVGDFVEWGEQRFIVDGSMDPRDLRANWQGQQFGLSLLNDPRSRPSRFLRVDLAHESFPLPDFLPRRAEPHPVEPEAP